MENGTISAMGNHNELLTKSDIYREIYNQQTGGAKDE
jgi:ABC-type multidrug transport system fused ATPase/permease subunit